MRIEALVLFLEMIQENMRIEGLRLQGVFNSSSFFRTLTRPSLLTERRHVCRGCAMT